jgi:cobalt/nickel transport system permease protein
MHMADALISPAVGIAMMAATAGAAAYSIKKVKPELDDKKVPFMGVMGAFVFAAQMINFTIPGTGSSGHLAGGILLAALLGPYAGFLTLLSVLLVQALFFADGGLLAYGANVFNMGFYACFIAYPLIMKFILRKGYSPKRIFAGSMLASITALQLGAFSVVLETLLSGKTELPFAVFASLMQPIHLAIGVVEGLVTAAVVTFVWRARPEILEGPNLQRNLSPKPMKKVLIVFIVLALAVGGFVSWFASSNPDGLEWSMINTTGQAELEAQGEVYTQFSEAQQNTAVLPDYGFKDSEAASANAGTSVSGIVGAVITLAIAGLIGFLISFFRKRRRSAR